ncbi:MAG TPA: hypothetical protein VHG53_06800 [Candidatus Limnocylindria bacterium]|nr:hypothetical protein [Candidatus Limnocylindria bacterium]
MNSALVRWGLWAIPVAGGLTLLPWLPLFLGGNVGPGSDSGTLARAATSPWSALLGNMYIVGVLCLLFGTLALYSILAASPGRGAAALGMVLGLVALVMVAGVWIILTYVDAVLGDLYLAGNQGAGDAFKSMTGGSWSPRFIPLFIVGGLAGLIAAISLGTALWRSRRVPKWVAILFAVAFLGSVISAPVITLVAAILLIVTGLAMARGMTMSAPV